MNEFSINKAALVEIHRIFRRSKCHKPVARLYEMADQGYLFNEFKAAHLGGTKSKDELSAMGKKRFEEVENQLESSLMVGASEHADYRPEDLFEVEGIMFVMGVGVPEMLREYCLTFEDDHFLLRSADNVAHTLRSLAKK